MNLNLGAGKKIIKNAVNVDIMPGEGIDQIVDLSVFPWPWKDESIDAIHASHIIEHFPDQKQFIEECLRVLKRGGLLKLNIPHSSCVTSIGCLGHYRTYSYDTFKRHLSEPWYMFKTKRFETMYQELRWWYEAPDLDARMNNCFKFIVKILNPIFNFLAGLSPGLCENVWCYWVGGFKEVVWVGIKI